MDPIKQLAETFPDKEMRNCLLELSKLVKDLQSTSLNGVIRSVRSYFNPKESFQSFHFELGMDGMVDRRIDKDVETKTDCLLELWKLNAIVKNINNVEEYWDEQPMATLAETAEISASYFVPFGIQVGVHFTI